MDVLGCVCANFVMKPPAEFNDTPAHAGRSLLL